MSKMFPDSREEAFAYQFEDDARRLHSMAKLGKEEFKKYLAVLQSHIDAYNDPGLQKACEDAEEKHKQQKVFMQEKFPTLNY